MLDEEVLFGIELRQRHRALEVEREPLLYTAHAHSLGQVQEQREVQDYRGGEDRVAGQEVYLDLHRVAEPAEDVYVVPTLFGVAPRRVVVDLDDVRDVSVESRVHLWLQDMLTPRAWRPPWS